MEFDEILAQVTELLCRLTGHSTGSASRRTMMSCSDKDGAGYRRITSGS